VLGERRTDGSPGVGDVVRRAGGGLGGDAGRDRHEHVRGPRDAHAIGQEAAEAPAALAHAEVVGEALDAQAEAGAPAHARLAGAAGDLERHADQVAELEPVDGVAQIDDAGDAFVPERERPGERGPAVHDPGVEIARGDDDGLDDGVLVALQAGRLDLAPLHQAGLDERRLSHHGCVPGAGPSVTRRSRCRARRVPLRAAARSR
jgi:hypothetical protein